MYKQTKDIDGTIRKDQIQRIVDGANIPFNNLNRDYQEYLKWLDGYEFVDGQWTKTSNGNTPEPADE